MAILISKQHFKNAWAQINRILGLKDANGNRTSIADLNNYNNFEGSLKIDDAHIKALNNKINEMKKDEYYKEDTENYLVTYSGDTTGTIKENLYSYLDTLKTNTASIICRNLFTNSHGNCPNVDKQNGEKTHGKWEYGQSRNDSGHRPSGSSCPETAKSDRCDGGSCSYTDKSNGFDSHEKHSNGPCANETVVDLYCNNKGGI